MPIVAAITQPGLPGCAGGGAERCREHEGKVEPLHDSTCLVAEDTARSPDEAIRAFTPVFDGLWRNPGPPLPHFASLPCGLRILA